MKTGRATSIAITILLMTALAEAGVIPGRWEKVEALASGTQIILKLRGGERLEAAFLKIGPEEIVLIEPRGIERRLPRIAVLRIETASVVRDRLCNGALYGNLIGAAGGIAAIVAIGESKTNGPVYWGDEDGPAYLLAGALVGGAIGAASGAIIDASIKRPEVLYEAIEQKQDRFEHPGDP